MWGIETTELEHTALGVIILLMFAIGAYFVNRVLSFLLTEGKKANHSFEIMSQALVEVTRHTEESNKTLNSIEKGLEKREQEHEEIIELLEELEGHTSD